MVIGIAKFLTRLLRWPRTERPDGAPLELNLFDQNLAKTGFPDRAQPPCLPHGIWSA